MTECMHLCYYSKSGQTKPWCWQHSTFPTKFPKMSVILDITALEEASGDTGAVRAVSVGAHLRTIGGEFILLEKGLIAGGPDNPPMPRGRIGAPTCGHQSHKDAIHRRQRRHRQRRLPSAVLLCSGCASPPLFQPAGTLSCSLQNEHSGKTAW